MGHKKLDSWLLVFIGQPFGTVISRRRGLMTIKCVRKTVPGKYEIRMYYVKPRILFN